ncbi:MAG: lysylphosphatidylglycerol synthase transmembrane domain-containing protein [Candidatus Solibacter sp.]
MWWLAGVVVVAAVVWLLRSRRFEGVYDWELARQSVAGIHWGWVAISLLPMLGTYLGRALRWAVFLRPLKPHPSMRHLLSATVVGFTAITLFGRPGEFVRPYLIARKEQVPVTSQFAAWVLERIFDLLMALILFAFALTRVQASGLRVGSNLSWVLAAGGKVGGALAVIILLILLGLRHFAEPLRLRLIGGMHRISAKRAAGVEKTINALFQGVESMRSDGALVVVLLYSVLEWVLICGCYWCLAQAFAGIVNLGVVDVLILMGFVSFGSIVQIPGVGGGMQVVSVLVLTELFGVRLEPATAFALFLWAITFVVIVPLGMFVALKEGLDWHSLKRIGREESE